MLLLPTPWRMPSLRASLTVAVAAVVLPGLLPPVTGAHGAAPAVDALRTPAALAVPDDAGCEAPLFEGPVRAARARRTAPVAFARAAAEADDGPLAARGSDLATLADDLSLWLDPCGTPFYVEPARAGAPDPGQADTATAAGTGPVVPLGETFTLASLPGSAHTVYLDFTGGTVTGTAWNRSYGIDPVTVAPYDDGGSADTAFTSAELVQVQQAWSVLAADYAVFDVNVTTRWPGQGAITRSGPSDPSWGSHVRVTGAGPIYARCGCGGVAYVGAMAASSNHADYQPAWVFADGTGHSGKSIGEAASHEVGHQLGLDHDGIGSADYHLGDQPWAPIMGAGYYQPLTQWSAGEYPGATNTEDDVAVITRRLTTPTDDHGDGSTTPSTPLERGAALTGRITTRTDVDAFSVRAAGATTLAVSLPHYSDLDVSLEVLTASGTRVALVDPRATRQSRSVASGLEATWTTTLPEGVQDLTVVVDGTGQGPPGALGSWSDYGSLGAYSILLTTQAPGPPSPATTPPPQPPQTAPLTARGATWVPGAVRSEPYAARPVLAEGGAPPYRWTATGLPAGLVIDGASGEVRGTPSAAGSSTVRVTVADAAGATVASGVTLAVDHPATRAADRTLEAVVGRPVQARLSATGGDGVTYTWSPAAAASLPAGLDLSPNGTLSGAPSTSGTTSTDVVARSGGSAARATLVLRTAEQPFTVTTRTRGLPVAVVGRRYRGVVRTSGAQGAVSWHRVRGALPRGLRWRAAAAGRAVVLGRARTTGRRVLVLGTTDATGRSTQRRLVVRATG